MTTTRMPYVRPGSYAERLRHAITLTNLLVPFGTGAAEWIIDHSVGERVAR